MLLLIKIVKVVGDITSALICKKVVDDAVQAFGKINILVSYTIFKLKSEANSLVYHLNNLDKWRRNTERWNLGNNERRRLRVVDECKR